MKKIIVIFILLFQVQQNFAQKQMSKVFDGKTKIVFLGLDFTQAKFIGEEGFKDPYKLKTYYLSNWNALLEEEYAKYNLPLNSLKARHYETNTSDLMILNDGIEDIEDAIINGSHYIDEKDVQNRFKELYKEIDLPDAVLHNSKPVVHKLSHQHLHTHFWVLIAKFVCRSDSQRETDHTL